jgi:hypothetical protein
MTSTVYTDFIGPPVNAAWLNDVNNAVYNGAIKGGGATGGGADAVFVENDCVVANSYAIGQNSLLSNVAISIASPAVFSLSLHGFVAGQQVRFGTTGSLPTGLDTVTAYYVIATALTANVFQVSTSYAGAAVATSGTQVGIHSVGKIKNAESAGPVTVLDGVTVTIPSGAVWSIV